MKMTNLRKESADLSILKMYNSNGIKHSNKMKTNLKKKIIIKAHSFSGMQSLLLTHDTATQWGNALASSATSKETQTQHHACNSLPTYHCYAANFSPPYSSAKL